MKLSNLTEQILREKRTGWWLLLAAFVLTAGIYSPGLSGGYLFDDYPNIVDNQAVKPLDARLPSLVAAALSSPSSEFKRPLSSLSFAANYLVTGLDPYWMKLTNVIIHLLNGLLIFLLTRLLLRSIPRRCQLSNSTLDSVNHRIISQKKSAFGVISLAIKTTKINKSYLATKSSASYETSQTGTTYTTTCQTRSDKTGRHVGIVAALVATCWLLLPINVTAVLYVVQRMESLANLIVLLGLIGYVAGRRSMLANAHVSDFSTAAHGRRGFWLCTASIILATPIGLLAKETAVMLPLYALLVEWLIFGFRIANQAQSTSAAIETKMTRSPNKRLVSLFLLTLVLPLIIGMVLVLPDLLKPERWSSRDFTLNTRLLSEARIVVDYIVWTILPTPHTLSFYHDNFHISTGLFNPWTTAASIAALSSLSMFTWWLRKRQPLVALGVLLYIGSQLLTGTVLPLELIYEHRNYFASFGLLLALVPILAKSEQSAASAHLSFILPRRVLLVGLLTLWAGQTFLTALDWSNPLRLAESLAERASDSPRAQYELGRTYIIYSHYDPKSPFVRLAYSPLEHSAALPNSSILPEQALIFMNARMHLALKDAWWDSMIAKLKAHKPGVQDESSLGALTQCAHDSQCNLPKQRMVDAYVAALSHPHPAARLLAMYGDYAWNVLDDHNLGEQATADAVQASPREPAYRITMIRMLLVNGQVEKAHEALGQLQSLNFGGRLDTQLAELRALPDMH